ncbi:unnamed protein product [Rhizophagus irregularis]|nr:unnamed protein product [Rhizophagus irregularis]
MRCIFNFEENTKQIIVLKPNYEFLTWIIPIDSPSNLKNSFQLFKQHYLEAMGEHLQVDSEKDAEIIEAWDCSDMQVREEYGKLCSLQDLNIDDNYDNLFLINCYNYLLEEAQNDAFGMVKWISIKRINIWESISDWLTAGKSSKKNIDRIFKTSTKWRHIRRELLEIHDKNCMILNNDERNNVPANQEVFHILVIWRSQQSLNKASSTSCVLIVGSYR